MSAKRLLNILIFLFSLTLIATLPTPSAAGPFKKDLPSQVFKDPDLCAYAPCKNVLPGADSFSLRKGHPPYVEAYSTSGGSKTLVGYVFLSTDIVDIPGYSGKPVVTLIGMDTEGIIKEAKVLWHSEPILMVGIPETELTKFVKQYVGKFVGDKIKVGEAKGGYLGVDAISGATVTVIAENQIIMRSGYQIAKQVGIVKSRTWAPVKINDQFSEMDWKELFEEGSIRRLVVMASDLDIWGEDQVWMDLYFGYLDQPSIGKNILGKYRYESLMRKLSEGDHAIFIIGKGKYSFKGSGFVRGAIFDRIQISQGDETFTFKDLDYYNLTDIPIKGAPEFKEGGIFIVREGSFAPGYPWSLIVLAAKRELGKKKEFFSFSRTYTLPEKYVIGERVMPSLAEEMPWVSIWKNNIPDIVFFSIYLITILVLFTKRDRLIRNRLAAKWTRYGIMAVGLFYVGVYRTASPSVTQAIALTHNFISFFRGTGFQWGLFLSDPIIFILWWFIGITIVLWGRGVFCGWICPYGALTEFSYKIFHTIFPKRFRRELPFKVHKRLIYLKYLVFAFLLGVSLYSTQLAEFYSEVEPFKTAFLVGVFRGWPYVVYFFTLIALCLVSYRFFCKYICPLGAGLAVPSTFRLFGIKRRDFCTKCSICARECDSMAIDEKGNIDKRECLWCLNCEENFWDSEKCPVLIKEKKGKP